MKYDYPMMQRIVVLGCCGAGKSTLARRLGDISGLPVIHLDAHYWQPGWVETPETEWPAKVEELAAGSAWIIDGNYSSTLPVRLRRCDTAIFLDFPRYKCLWGVVRRRVYYRGRPRPDMGPGCPEQLELEFLRFVWHWHRERRHRVVDLLESHKNQVEVVTLTNRRAVELFAGDFKDRTAASRATESKVFSSSAAWRADNSTVAET